MRVITRSGTVYEFSGDGTRLISRDRPGSTLPQYRDTKVLSWFSAFPPVVDRRMTILLDDGDDPIITTPVVEVIP